MSIARVIARSVRPTFTHDCTTCAFLGSLDGKDIYYCAADGAVIARHGHEGQDYGAFDLSFGTPPAGSVYSFAVALGARGAVTKPNAYRSTRWAMRECKGCESCA